MRAIICSVIYFVSINLSADEMTEKYYSDMAKLTNRTFCHDKATLSYIDKNYKSCEFYIDSVSKECVVQFTKAMPQFQSVEEFIKHEELVENLAKLYIACVKSKIFEDVENVIMVKDSDDN